MGHGSVRPMLAVVSVGDCGLVILRRTQRGRTALELIFSTDMQDPHLSTPRLCRNPVPSQNGSIECMDIGFFEELADTKLVSIQDGDIIILCSGAAFGVLSPEALTRLCSKCLEHATPIRDAVVA